MAKLKQLSFSFIFFTFANALEALTPMVLIPVLTRYLSRYDYGLWALFQSVVVVLIPIISLSFKDAVRMRFLSLSSNELRQYINGAACIMVMIAVLGVAIAFMLHDILGVWLKLNPSGLYAIFVISCCYGFFYMALAVCQFAKQKRMFAYIQLTQSIVSICSTVVFVMHGSGWQGCVFGRLIGLGVACMVAAWFLYRHLGCFVPMQASKDAMRSLWGFGWRYLPSGLFVVIIPLTNRLLITRYVGVEQTSVFAVSESLSMMLNLVVVGFIHAWQPWLFRKLAGQDDHGMQHILLGCSLFVIGLPCAGFVMSYIAEMVIPYLLGSQFHGAQVYMLPLMMMVSMLGFVQMMKGFLHFYRRIAWMSLCSLVAMIVHFILAQMWIPTIGVQGAIWAAISAYASAFFVGLMVLAYYHKVQNKV